MRMHYRPTPSLRVLGEIDVGGSVDSTAAVRRGAARLGSARRRDLDAITDDDDDDEDDDEAERKREPRAEKNEDRGLLSSLSAGIPKQRASRDAASLLDNM